MGQLRAGSSPVTRTKQIIPEAKPRVLFVLCEVIDAEPLRPQGRTLDAPSLNSDNIYLERQAKVQVLFKQQDLKERGSE